MCRLTETTSTGYTPTEPKEPTRRAEPTEEARTAGQAALARLEAKKSDKPRFNTYVIFIYYHFILTKLLESFYPIDLCLMSRLCIFIDHMLPFRRALSANWNWKEKRSRVHKRRKIQC